jgi:hypothetical protein
MRDDLRHLGPHHQLQAAADPEIEVVHLDAEPLRAPPPF